MASFDLPNSFWYEDGLHQDPVEQAATFDRVREATLSPQDVMIATYRKAGSTWLCSILDLIFNSDKLDDRDHMKLEERVRVIDFTFPHRDPRQPELDYILQSPSPRTILTHLPYPVFKKQVQQDKLKVIVVLRNPRDTLVSYYHFYKAIRGIQFPGSFADFIELAKAKKLIGGDFWEYYQGWWGQKDLENIYFCSYEDMKKNPFEEMKKLADFCGKSLADDIIQRIVEKTSFKSMSANPAVNHQFNPAFDQKISKFMRKGEVGDWQNHFTPEQIEFCEQREKEVFGGNGPVFKYSI